MPDLHLPHALVSTGWLAAHLDHAALRIVDARWRGDGSSRQRYAAGHIPGAVPLDWQRDLGHTADGVRDLLLPPDRFAAVMAGAGIGASTAVVAYAESDYSGAARVWWALRYYGHDNVAVLDGGLNKWLAEGRPVSRAETRPPPAWFVPQPRPELLATGHEIAEALAGGEKGVCLVDTRPREQYAGAAVWTPQGSRYLAEGAATIDVGARAPMRAGHIPGAVHLHASANLDPQTWTFFPPEELRDRALAAGVRPEQRVVTYCGVGISASLGLLALHLAGYENLALYDASWEEWGTDPRRPVEPPG